MKSSSAIISSEQFEHVTFTAPQARVNRWLNTISGHYPSDARIRILEIGCGTGQTIIALAQLFPHATLVGVDISVPNIQAAQKNLITEPAIQDRVQFIAEDYLNSKLEAFDFIFSDSTLHLIPVQTGQLFRKISQDLKPAGILASSMPVSCTYNNVLVAMRKILRAARCSLTDAIILKIGKALHPEMTVEMIEQRVHYAYIIPYCYLGTQLDRMLENDYQLKLIMSEKIEHASFAQPIHQLSLYQKSSKVSPLA